MKNFIKLLAAMIAIDIVVNLAANEACKTAQYATLQALFAKKQEADRAHAAYMLARSKYEARAIVQSSDLLKGGK